MPNTNTVEEYVALTDPRQYYLGEEQRFERWADREDREWLNERKLFISHQCSYSQFRDDYDARTCSQLLY